MKLKMGSAAILFFGVLVATLFVQVSESKSQSRLNDSLLIPNAELELDTLDQVQEINDHNFKNFEIHAGDEN